MNNKITYHKEGDYEKTEEELKCVNTYSEEQVKSDIEYAKENGAEYICVMIHWGDAISNTVSKEQKSIADFLVESGVNLIIGAHPSVVQPMEIIKNNEGEDCLVAYSLGDYTSDFRSENSNLELILNIQLYLPSQSILSRKNCKVISIILRHIGIKFLVQNK